MWVSIIVIGKKIQLYRNITKDRNNNHVLGNNLSLGYLHTSNHSNFIYQSSVF